MDVLSTFFENFLTLLNAMSIYIIAGLFIAGILKQFIPDDFVAKHLGEDSTSSVVKATIFGLPLPVCSCSVIPIAQGLKKEGASKGAVQSFLISTPITGVDSILATYSLFGFVFTAFRVVSSMIIAISVGLVQNFIFKEKTNEERVNDESSSSCCSSTSCCSSNKTSKKFSFQGALQYGYVTLFKDMAKALIIGLVLGALFISIVPKEYTQLLFENQFLTYIVIMLFSMPLYTCATASLPFAAAFMMQGMSPGAVFIFLTAGPATSMVTMSVVYKMLGRGALIVYLTVIAVLALMFGFVYDTFFQDLSVLTVVSNHEDISILNWISSFIMMALILYHLLKDKFARKKMITEVKTNTFNPLKPDMVNQKITTKVDFSKNIKNKEFID